MVAGRVVTDPDRCRSCFRCVEACPSGARVRAARPYDVDELLEEVLRDRDFFGDDGGLTLSGGEPLVHVGFLSSFLEGAKREGLHVAAETAGYWHYQRVQPLLKHIDLLLFDVKVIDERRHRALTGKSNARILENLRKLVDDGHRVVVRMPLVPGVNDGANDLRSVAGLLQSLDLGRIMLLPYHPMGQSKLTKLIRAPAPLHACAPTSDEFLRAAALFTDEGIDAARA